LHDDERADDPVSYGPTDVADNSASHPSRPCSPRSPRTSSPTRSRTLRSLVPDPARRSTSRPRPSSTPFWLARCLQIWQSCAPPLWRLLALVLALARASPQWRTTRAPRLAATCSAIWT
jgi:hypothetical protein